MNKKGEFNFKNVFIVVLFIGLFFSIMTAFLLSFSEDGDLTGYNESDISIYIDVSENITADINKTYQDVDTVTIAPDWFDFLSGVWNKLISPFKFISNSIITTIILAYDITSKFKLLPIWGTFLVTMLLLWVTFLILKHFNILKK